ncbi:MAG: hypothetical protein FJX75_05520 [Armatimonadetes bacterium]|nr:hypothetical protein [Armatimonadota bacterium]
MPPKGASRRKPPVPVLTAPEAVEHASLYRTKAFPFVSEGTVYCFGLREYLVEPSIPRGESAIGALLALASGTVFGLTTGERSHLFYFHPGFGVAHVGPVSDGPAGGAALLHLGGNQILGGWWGPKGGGLFRHNATVEIGQGMEQFRGAKGAIEPLKLPEVGYGLAAFAGPTDDAAAYGLTLPDGALIRIDAGSHRTKVVARVANPTPVLVLLPSGVLLGAFAEGRLWQYAPDEGRLTALDAHAPCQKGKRYVAGVQGLILADDGLVYGGTSTDGFLFSFDPATHAVVNLGKPNRQSNIRALAQGHDGRLYGLVEEPQGLAHLFRFEPTTRGFCDLGVLGAAFPECWTAHSLGAITVGPNGELFIGETDSLSHLFVYYPPIPRRKEPTPLPRE